MLSWKNDQKIYKRIHMRLARQRGPARYHECVNCAEDGVKAQAGHWAQVHTESGLDIWADYIPLCQSCHFRYDEVHTKPGWHHTDETRRKMSATRIGKPKSAEHKAKISAGLRGRKLSAETKAKISAARRGMLLHEAVSAQPGQDGTRR